MVAPPIGKVGPASWSGVHWSEGSIGAGGAASLYSCLGVLMIRFSEFLQKSESFWTYNVNIADFTQISEYFYCLLKLFHVMRQTCFPSQ